MHPLQQGDGKEGGAAAAQLGWGEVPSYRQAVLGDLLELWPRKALPHECLERHLDPASSPKSVTLLSSGRALGPGDGPVCTSQWRRGQPGETAPEIPKLPESRLCTALLFLPFPRCKWQPKGLPSSESMFTHHRCQGRQGLAFQGQEALGLPLPGRVHRNLQGLDLRSGPTQACSACEREGKGHS